MVMALQKLLRTECSPLEGSVGYAVPDSTVLAALLTQLEGLQALWAQVDRSALTPVKTCTSLQHQVLALLLHFLGPMETVHCFAIGVSSNTCMTRNMFTGLRHKFLLCFAEAFVHRKLCVAVGLVCSQLHAGQAFCGNTTSWS